jgi:hypothetical protein
LEGIVETDLGRENLLDHMVALRLLRHAEGFAGSQYLNVVYESTSDSDGRLSKKKRDRKQH